MCKAALFSFTASLGFLQSLACEQHACECVKLKDAAGIGLRAAETTSQRKQALISSHPVPHQEELSWHILQNDL